MRKLTAVSKLRGYRQFYYGGYGGTEGVAQKPRQTLIAAHPGLEVAGTLCPPFQELTPEEDQSVVDTINAARPDIVWVGLGAPMQELWMANYLGRVSVPVMIGVGAAFDFLAGTKPQAPSWMKRNGLEWLFRLCFEPRRLWRRYTPFCRASRSLAAIELTRRALRMGRAKRWTAI
jgi:N-acetylglucosaminyldiphosphoundecaprenol N-acetyl-beta-D-mannosaminyltransferase